MSPSLASQLLALREQRAQAIDQMEQVHDKAASGGRMLSPAEEAEFEGASAAVTALDAKLGALDLQMRKSAMSARPIGAGSRSADPFGVNHALGDDAGETQSPPRASAFGLDLGNLSKSLRASGDWQSGNTRIKTVLQGVGVGNLGGTRQEGGLVVQGQYGSVPLVQCVEILPATGSSFSFNRVRPGTMPAVGGKQANEGDIKALVQIGGAPVTLQLSTFASYEKVSLQALQDQAGLQEAIESILRGATLRAADIDAWARIDAGSTSIVPSDNPIATILRTSALIASAGGSAIRAVVNPLDLTEMALLRAEGTTGQWLGLPEGMTLPPLLQSSGIPAGKVLVTAGTGGAFTAVRQELVAAVGLEGEDFIRNLRTVLLEGRMVSDVRDPMLSYVGDLVEA